MPNHSTTPQEPHASRRLRPWVCIALGCVGVALLVCVRLWFDLGSLPEDARSIALSLRAQTLLTAGIVGCSLAVAGVLLQSLLRNPLASPDVLGLASGAGLGIMAVVYASYLATGLLADKGGLGAGGAAVVGALALLALVYAVSQRRGLIDPLTLVLVGVVTGIMCSSGITIIQHLLPDQGMASARLIVGALRDDARPGVLWTTGLVTLAGVVVSCVLAPSMDRASLGDDEATSVGVNLRVLRTVQFLVAGLLTACSVLLAGPLAFVGLVCPHLVRMVAGPSHRTLVIGSALCGGAMVIAGDLAVALLKSAVPDKGRLPLGVVTAVVGGPIFLMMLRSRKDLW